MTKTPFGVYVSAAVVALLVVVGALWLHAPSTTPKAGSGGAGPSQPWECDGYFCQWKIAANCNTGTTTLFDVQNPWQATSTVSLDYINGQGQATSTQFSVGTTTTTNGGLALANISPTLVNGATIATTSNFTVVGGQTGNLGTGQISAGSNTLKTIVVGANEYIGAFGTSTYSNGGATNYVGGLNTCQYGLIFTRDLF